MSKVRIGFVGVGFMGQAAHLSNYANLPDAEVVAIAEVLPELAKKVAAKYGIPKVYSSHDEMLSKEKLDGVVASQPFTRHGTLVPELAKAGIPVASFGGSARFRYKKAGVRAWRNGRRTGLKPLSAQQEIAGVELPKFGETFAGNPEPSPKWGRCRD